MARLSGSRLHLGYHGTPVVRDASIALLPGRVTALVGPNGSGESTLLRALARAAPRSPCSSSRSTRGTPPRR